MPFGAPGGTRTPDLQVRSLPFYPAKLQAHINMNIKLRNEPPMVRFGARLVRIEDEDEDEGNAL